MTCQNFVDWTREAWLNWHRPWALMHESWCALGHDRLIDAGATEYWLRLHYADWCASYDLSSAPVSALLGGVDARDPGWRLLALSRDEFDCCLRLVDWTLRFAAHPADRLKRGEALAIEEIRWCLARAPLIPEVLARSTGRVGGRSPCASSMAAGALYAWLQTASPMLWPRLRLRCDRDAILAAERTFRDGNDADDARDTKRELNAVGVLGARLWRAALRETAGPAASARVLVPEESATVSNIKELMT